MRRVSWVEFVYVVSRRFKICIKQGIFWLLLAMNIRIRPANFLKMPDAVLDWTHSSHLLGLGLSYTFCSLFCGRLFHFWSLNTFFCSDFAPKLIFQQMVRFCLAHIFFHQGRILSASVSYLSLKALFQLGDICISSKFISPLEKSDLVINFALLEICVQKFSPDFVGKWTGFFANYHKLFIFHLKRLHT